jgi:hypothetical protein
LAVEEEILHERSMSGAVIYISEFQNKLAWKLGISVSLALEDMTLNQGLWQIADRFVAA